MHKSFSLFFLFLFLTFFSIAQTNADYEKKFTAGNKLFIEKKYNLALKNFQEAYQIDSVNSAINYKIGVCYLNIDDKKSKAESFFKKAILNTSATYSDTKTDEKTAPQDAYYYYGEVLHLNYKFDEAIKQFEKYKSLLLPERKALISAVDNEIAISNNAKILVSAPVNVLIKNMGDSVNSAYADYGAVISNNEQVLIYTSRRPESTGGKKDETGNFFEDIYFSEKKPDFTWTKPQSISKNINTDGNESVVNLSKDEQTILINKKDSNGGDIYYSKYDGSDWTVPQPMGSNINTASVETNACISPDGNVLYFVSNRPGGLGGSDIWKCIKLPNGKWGNAINLGTPINTPYDEESPFIHPNGNILFFSSNGHNTIGGFDIFFAFATATGWDEPMNIGYPINSTDDDLFYVTSPNGESGYFSSTRPNGFGEKDIYVSTKNINEEEQLVLIKGHIIPAEGQKLSDDLEVTATNNNSDDEPVKSFRLMKDGSFTIILHPKTSYTLSYQNNGKEFYSETIEVPAEATFQDIEKELKLKDVIFDSSKK
jgi:hypothetical protein